MCSKSPIASGLPRDWLIHQRIHLPHLIADAVHHAHKGELKIDYDKAGYFSCID